MKFLLLVAMFTFSGFAFSCTEDGSEGFVPENDIYIPADAKYVGGLSEAEFNAVIDKIENLYAPIISNMGGKLVVNRKWTDGTANASATRSGSTWYVNMFGGLARHASITADGFSLVMCHEIGHHIGGAPKISGFFNRWASNEGQSDYFATTKCLRKAWVNDNNREVVSAMNVPELLKTSCSKVHGKNSEDYFICLRGGMAGVSVAGFFAAARNKPQAQFHTPDRNVVTKTFDGHPDHQCRLDTFFQGALCEVGMNDDVSQSEEVKGTCHGSLGHTVGTRPLCWFKPSVQ